MHIPVPKQSAGHDAVPTGPADARHTPTGPADESSLPHILNNLRLNPRPRLTANNLRQVESDLAAGPNTTASVGTAPSTAGEEDASERTSVLDLRSRPGSMVPPPHPGMGARQKTSKITVLLVVRCCEAMGDHLLTCGLCGVKFITKSPYGAAEVVEYGEFFPWATYYLVKDESTGEHYRRPKGKV